MLIHQKTEVFGTHVKITLQYVREHWHEWLWLFVSEGEAYPHFYLPVYRSMYRRGCVAWIIPLAPIVLVVVALHSSFMHFWNDCLWAIDRWRNGDVRINRFHK